MASGNYLIRNITNGKFYVGSAVNFIKRWNRHKFDLRHNIHDNKHLQIAWNKYGESSFIFEILEELPKEIILDCEQTLLDKYVGLEWCYNISKSVFSGMTGRHHSVESIDKIRKSNRGLKRTLEARLHMQKPKSKSHKMALSHAAHKRKATLKTRKAMSLAMQGKNSKINEDIVREIRCRYNDGETQKSIANSIGITNGIVWEVVNNNIWKWVK